VSLGQVEDPQQAARPERDTVLQGELTPGVAVLSSFFFALCVQCIIGLNFDFESFTCIELP
jgi:hypothetical protein